MLLFGGAYRFHHGGHDMFKSTGLCLLLLCSPLAACATNEQPPIVSSVNADKALYGAEAAFSGLLLAVNTAQDAGLLRGEKSAAASQAVKRAYDALLIARKTRSVADIAAAEAISKGLKEVIL